MMDSRSLASYAPLVRWCMLVLAALAGLSAPAPAAAVDLSQTCVNPDLPFAVRFPDGWWAHPADPSRQIASCEYFGPVPFTLTADENGGLAGSTVALYAVDACVGDFRDIVSRREMTVGGQKTTRVEFAASEGGPTHGRATALVYWIHLRGQECQPGETRYVIASTGSDDPEAYVANAAVLDAMMRTFALGRVPDGAMPARAEWGAVRWLGVLLVAAGVPLGWVRYQAHRGPLR